ncbi:MAG: CapA family protein [Peptococcaceae bacterium]|nr:CapA family protein [Peptococcaceae bacterium]
MVKRKNINLLFFISLLFLLSLNGCSFHQSANPGSESKKTVENGSNASPASPETKQGYVDITVAAAGDILIHNTLYYSAYDPETKSYDFRDQFKYVKPYLENADITLANLETTLAGPEKGYSSYPKFNTPDTIIDALKDTGVDIVTAANNHRMDTGVEGFYRTIRVVRGKGLDIIGVKADEKEKSYVIKNIKGVKIAFLNFGYGSPLRDGSLSINGLILPVNMSGLIDSFDPKNLETSVTALERKIKDAKNNGAELIVVSMHWGDEYHRIPNEFQRKLASRIASLGANAIFGGHPHVLEPVVYLPGSGESKVPVFYSLGNFISDQRKETVDDIYTEQGMIAKVTFRIEKNKNPQILFTQAIPTWVNKKIADSRFIYEVIPVQEALNKKQKFPLLNTQDLERIRFCSDTVEQLTLGIK